HPRSLRSVARAGERRAVRRPGDFALALRVRRDLAGDDAGEARGLGGVSSRRGSFLARRRARIAGSHRAGTAAPGKGGWATSSTPPPRIDISASQSAGSSPFDTPV